MDKLQVDANVLIVDEIEKSKKEASGKYIRCMR